MKKHLRVISLVAAVLGLLSLASGTAQAAITASPTISSKSHATNTSSTDSDIKISWTAATSGLSSTSITYEYLLDSTATHTHGSFTSGKSSAASTRAGQLSNTLSVEFKSVTDGTYYFHLRAYDTAGIVSGTAVLHFGPLILDSKPTLGSTPISPSKGDHSKPITVIITGSKFMSNVTAKLVNGTHSSSGHSAVARPEVQLTIVSVDSANQITATVPSDTKPGTYDLTVSNGTPNSQSVTSSKAYTSSNTPPVATAEADKTGKLSTSGTLSFTLTGTGTDADGDTLSDSSYSWTLSSMPSGATVTASGSGWSQDVAKTSASQSVVVNTAGDYTFTLKVDDGYDFNSTTATTKVTVGVATGNNKPTAKATASEGVSSPVTPGTAVILTGEISDLDGNTATAYAWVLSSVPTGSSLTASSLPESGATPTTSTGITQTTGQATASVTPDVVGTYTIVLYIKDSHNTAPAWSDGSGANSKLTLTANNKPTALITKNASDTNGVWNSGKGVLFTLDGSGSSDSDTSDQIASYAWSQTSGPENVKLSSSSAAKPTFTPATLGTYVFSLVVTDSAGSTSAADTVTVEVTTPPAAPSAGSDMTVKVTDGEVTVAGTTTETTASTYAWTLVSAPTDSTSTLTTASGTASTTAGALEGKFTPDKAGTYILSLTVSNSAAVASSADTVNVTVNTPPVAVATSSQEGAIVTLNGSDSSDADGANLTYTWTSTARPTGVAEGDVTIIHGSNSVPSATFRPSAVGDYTFTLKVSDGIEAHDHTATVMVTVASVVAFSLDIDGDGSYKALTDGLLIVRSLFRFSGDTLINGAVGSTATRTAAADISTYITDGSTALDVDGDGTAKALTDGLLIIRHLFRFSGASLVNGAVGANATRSEAAEISTYLDTLMPAL